MNKFDEILTRTVTNIIPGVDPLKKLLLSGKKLNVYLGIDPTATKIHIGNAVPLRKLQQFVKFGHNVTFLIGDFTALIGDTSDKDSERPVLSYEQIQENFKTYKKQASKIVDFSKVQVKFNGNWLKKLKFTDVVKLCQNFSVGDFVGRELIKKRLNDGKKVGLHEVLYPVMQGYDSYFMDTDIQIGGADQTFNMQAGRILQKNLRRKESFVMVTGYLEGTDGRKMSKSWNNAIWLEDAPNEMFGKVMSVEDKLIVQYYTCATNASKETIDDARVRLKRGENPIVIKKDLAFMIVSELHSKEDAEIAKANFENTVQKGNAPVDISELKIPMGTKLIDAVAQFVGSRSQAKRLIVQRAVDVNGKVAKDALQILNGSEIIKIGKKEFVKTIIK